MNNQQIIFDKDVIQLLKISEQVYQRCNYRGISKIIAFGTLALMQDSPLHRYLLKQGITEIEIATKTNNLLNNHKEEFVNKEELRILPISHQDTNTKESKIESFILENSFFETLKLAVNIGNKSYHTNIITNEYVFAALTETFTDLYLEFLISCFGRDAVLPKTANDSNELVIPKNLSSFLTVLNAEYQPDEKECNILGREEETNQLIRILAKATKRNAILVGEPGVGKTAIVEKFVWQVVTGNCHQKFRNSKIISLDVTSILAGTQYRGSAEDRFKGLIEFLEYNPGCILFIDEIHTILGAGACREGDLDLANSLKPILARGTTQVIGATTSEEYTKYFSKDGALKRRFEKIVVNEPHADQVYDMIKNQISRLERFHNTTISKKLVDFIILNASCFHYETRNPDRTLDLLDKSMTVAELKNKSKVDKSDILENFAIRKKQFKYMSKERKMATAYHEAGHCIIQHYAPELREYYNVLAVSIMPAENYLGVNVFEQNENLTLPDNKNFYIQTIARLLGGRIAEKKYTGQLSAGASSDLEKATKIAKDMVTRYGLDEDFAQNRVYLKNTENSMYTESIKEKINGEIDKILEEAYKYADAILKERTVVLEKLVEELMKKGILSMTDLEKIFNQKKE